MTQSGNIRVERDTFGTIDVPADKLWGAQTQRSLQNFDISGEQQPREIIKALAQVKRASAVVSAWASAVNSRTAPVQSPRSAQRSRPSCRRSSSRSARAARTAERSSVLMLILPMPARGARTSMVSGIPEAPCSTRGVRSAASQICSRRLQCRRGVPW